MLNWKGFLAASLLISGSAFATDGMIVRFDLTNSMKTFLRANEFDITGVNYNTNEIEALLTPEELKIIESQKANIKFSFPQKLSLSPDSEYKNPNEIEDFIHAIHAKYPEITEVKSIGKSLEGRDIWAIKISDNADIDEHEPVFFVNGMHHAREVMTPEITTDMVEYLTSNYGKNAEVTSWVNNSEIWVIPMLNVDGNNKMWTEDSMWRKNTRNGFGVDINRNYPTGWNSCSGSSSNTYAQDYRGAGPGSEPETQAMMNFVAAIKPVFSISYHSYSEIVLYPYGCRPKKTPTEEAVESIGAEIAKKLDYKPGTPWELLYNADGGDIDWMYVEHQVIPYVIEVNSTFAGFHPNYARWRDKTVLRNRPGWMHLLNKLQGPGLQGVVGVGDYHVIKIMKAGETKVSQTYKINPDGSYYVILKPGTYDVSFEGRKTQKFTGVDVKAKRSFNL
ncbi:M14 family metallopeptidase [Peredibacter sp. HCB2-198]|uniref:M14 family metallopeptidase n=1 Tax=Peredibacter sp. HCB2-198 TaxID=3383025 RepID=UPI0038B4EBBC